MCTSSTIDSFAAAPAFMVSITHMGAFCFTFPPLTVRIAPHLNQIQNEKDRCHGYSGCHTHGWTHRAGMEC
jgi:hypothetical protein